MKEEDGKEIMGKARREIYRSLFLKEVAIPARIGKTVYVRKEYHERIQLILRVIGKDEVSLFSYIDNDAYSSWIEKTWIVKLGKNLINFRKIASRRIRTQKCLFGECCQTIMQIK